MKNTTEVQRPQKRTWRSAQQRARLIRKFKQSDVTCAEFCRMQGINSGTFYRWLRASKEECSPVATFAEVALPTPPPADIEICLPNGARVLIRHNDKPVELAKLIRGVSGC